MVNNGIISNGNNNINIVQNSSTDLERELLSLLKELENTTDYPIILSALTYYKENKESKFKECLKSISKNTINLIKRLGLVALEKLIEQLIVKC